MKPDKQNTGDETAGRNRQEPHNPAQAGREAIEAGKVNESGKPASQQREEEAKDAERWRAEG